MENVHIKKELFFKNVRRVILFSIIIISLDFHLICPVLCQENYGVVPSTVQKNNPIKLSSDYADYVKEKDTLFAQGSVNADYEGTVIKCDTMTINFLEKELLAFGNGSINGGYFDIFGDTITYNYETKEGTVINANCRVDDWYFRGPKIEMKGEKTIILQNGFCTSCDLKHPHYRFSAGKIVIIPEEIVKLYMLSFRIKDTPVLFAPYLQFSLKKKKQEAKKRRKGNYQFGSNTEDGYFFRTWMPYKLIKQVDGLAEVKVSRKNQFEFGMDNKYDIYAQSYRAADFNTRSFRNEHKDTHKIINEVFIQNGIIPDDTGTHTPEKLKKAFNELVKIPNLKQLLEENKGSEGIAQGIADEETVRLNRKELAGIYPSVLGKNEDLPYITGDLIVQHNNRLIDAKPKSNWNIYGKHNQDFPGAPGLKLQANINYTNDIYFNRRNNYDRGTNLLRGDMELVNRNIASDIALTYAKPNYSLSMVVNRKDLWDDELQLFYPTLRNLPVLSFALNKRKIFSVINFPVYIAASAGSGTEYENYYSPGSSSRSNNDYFKKYSDGSASLSTSFNINKVNIFSLGMNYTRNWQDRKSKDDLTDSLNETAAVSLGWISDLMNVCLLPVRIDYSFGWNFLENQSSNNSMVFKIDSSRGRSRKKGELGAVIRATMTLPQINGSEAVVIPSIKDINDYFYNNFSNVDMTMNYDTEKSNYNLRYVYSIKNPLYKPYSVDAQYKPVSGNKPLKSFKVVYLLTAPNKFDLTGEIGLLRKDDWKCDFNFRADLFFDNSIGNSKFTENGLVITKDLHCWEMAFNWNRRPSSTEFWVKFNIKVIQEVKIGASNRHYKNLEDGSWDDEFKILTK